jgi:SAM-dependent methyltransferase
MLETQEENRFQDFFEEETYVILKNLLYNYRLRKRAIERVVQPEQQRLILEVGSGLSPIVTTTDHVVYSELSFTALRNLRAMQRRGHYVVADATRLPFREGTFSHSIASEVMEHLPEDQPALGEMVRVTDGAVTVTVPYRRFHFANDDRFVRHFRRYEPGELEAKLEQAGGRPRLTRVVLGPLEKLTMRAVIAVSARVFRFEESNELHPGVYRALRLAAPVFGFANWCYAGVVWLDCRVMPDAWGTCVLVTADTGEA